MTPLDELFMAETMIGMVKEFADQSEERSFLAPYEGGGRILPTSNDFVYDELTYSRGLAPVAGPDSPSTARKPLGPKKRAGTVFAVKAHVDLPAGILMMARGAGQSDVDPEFWLRENLQNLTNEVQRTRNYIAAQSLHAAEVDLAAVPNADIDGAYTLTFPIETLSATASWALAATKLRSEMATLRRTYKRNVGFNPGIALASDVVEGYITENESISNPVNNTPSLAQRKIELSYLEGGSLARFAGIDWQFVRDDYVTDANQETADAADDATPTVSDVITDTDLVPVIPPRGRWSECFAMVEGRVFMPTGPIASAAVGNPFSLMAESRGWAVWLELITNPIGLRLHVRWHGNFVQKRRACVLVYNTTP